MMSALLVSSAPAMAQNNNKAIIDNVTKIIASKAPNTEDQVKEIFKANKKNPEVLVGIGQAYLNVKDTANASKYAELALKRDNKYAKAWILAGCRRRIGTVTPEPSRLPRRCLLWPYLLQRRQV